MIELCFKRTKLRLDFSFFAVLAMFLLADRHGFGILSLTACAAHEMSHFIVMRFCGVEIKSVTFYGAGVMISADTDNAAIWKQLMIFSAGAVMNFALCLALMVMGSREAAAVNLLIGLFNLLPIGEFDGARILRLAALKFARPEEAEKIERIAEVMSLFLVAAVFVLFRKTLGFTFITTMAYVIIVVLLRI